MTFTIEFSDTHFRLVIKEHGEEDYDSPVLFCSVSSIVATDGKVYGAYLTGSETDLETIDNNPDEDFISLVSTSIKVYDLTNWPNLKPLDASVTILAADFEGLEDDEDEEEGETVDVVPIA
jgi:hypothetical protein